MQFDFAVKWGAVILRPYFCTLDFANHLVRLRRGLEAMSRKLIGTKYKVHGAW
jgi:hypothetical protein